MARCPGGRWAAGGAAGARESLLHSWRAAWASDASAGPALHALEVGAPALSPCAAAGSAPPQGACDA
jgi:hypothetical protein